jgi:hypothetical protein
MPFKLPDTFAPKYQKDGTPRTLSPNTIKTYKSRLNKLASQGFSNVDELLRQSQDVILTINTLVPGMESPALRQEKRIYFCAIFWVLPESVLKSQNPYYKAFQGVRDWPE